MSYTEITKDTMRSFNTLVKFGGCWKSVKQARFLLKQCEQMGFSKVDATAYAEDVVLEQGQQVIVLDTTVRWADYGRRSIRRYGFMYIVDKFGIVKRYKLKFFHEGGYTTPNKKGAVVDFVRESVNPEIIAAFEAEEVEKTAVNKRHIGTVGERMETQLTLKYISESYGNYGITTIYKFVDAEGNDIIWFSSRNIGIEKDKTYNMSFSVKAHDNYKDSPSTIITRAKIK